MGGKREGRFQMRIRPRESAVIQRSVNERRKGNQNEEVFSEGKKTSVRRRPQGKETKKKKKKKKKTTRRSFRSNGKKKLTSPNTHSPHLSPMSPAHPSSKFQLPISSPPPHQPSSFLLLLLLLRNLKTKHRIIRPSHTNVLLTQPYPHHCPPSQDRRCRFLVLLLRLRLS